MELLTEYDSPGLRDSESSLSPLPPKLDPQAKRGELSLGYALPAPQGALQETPPPPNLLSLGLPQPGCYSLGHFLVHCLIWGPQNSER